MSNKWYEKIVQLRKEKSMTQGDLADKLGISRATVARRYSIYGCTKRSSRKGCNNKNIRQLLLENEVLNIKRAVCLLLCKVYIKVEFTVSTTLF